MKSFLRKTAILTALFSNFSAASSVESNSDAAAPFPASATASPVKKIAFDHLLVQDILTNPNQNPDKYLPLSDEFTLVTFPKADSFPASFSELDNEVTILGAILGRISGQRLHEYREKCGTVIVDCNGKTTLPGVHILHMGKHFKFINAGKIREIEPNVSMGPSIISVDLEGLESATTIGERFLYWCPNLRKIFLPAIDFTQRIPAVFKLILSQSLPDQELQALSELTKPKFGIKPITLINAPIGKYSTSDHPCNVAEVVMKSLTIYPDMNKDGTFSIPELLKGILHCDAVSDESMKDNSEIEKLTL
ncbi:MAG: hypothetical protein HEEMFOPI_01180 [Holosporales bacterium]